MSLINSIFVDAMVEDNNDDIKLQLHNIEEKLNRLLEEKENNTNKNEKNNKKIAICLHFKKKDCIFALPKIGNLK